MAVYTTTQLITEVRRRMMLPNSQSAGTLDDDILAAADCEIESRLYPLVLQLQQEYFVDERQIPFGASSGTTQSVVTIPYDAVNLKLRDVFVVGPDLKMYNVPRFTAEDEYQWNVRYSGVAPLTVQNQVPQGFTIAGTYVRFYPFGAYTSGWRAILRFYRRPSTLGGVVERMTRTSTVPSVTTIQASQGVDLTFGSPGLLGGQYMFYRFAPPFEVLGSLSNVAANATAITIYPFQTGALFAGNVQVAAVRVDPTVSGAFTDSVSNSPFLYKSPFVQLPPEFSQLLVQRTVCRMLQNVRDLEALQIAEADAERMERALVLSSADRVDGEPMRITGGLYRSLSQNYGWVR